MTIFGGEWKNSKGVNRIYACNLPNICCVHMSDKVSDFFDNTIGVKQGCPLSATLFGLCIDELEEMVAKFAKEGVEEVAIGNVVIMLLLYADDVVLFANTLGNARKLMKALEKNCMC